MKVIKSDHYHIQYPGQLERVPLCMRKAFLPHKPKEYEGEVLCTACIAKAYKMGLITIQEVQL